KLLVQYSGTGLDPALVQNGARVYQISYKTSYKGQEIEASGLVVLPETKESVPMISFHRGTIVEYADAPSMQSRNSEEVLLYAALSSMGFIAVIPDMLGFGVSTSVLHPHYIEAPTSSAVTDLLVAATEWAAQRAVKFNTDVY